MNIEKLKFLEKVKIAALKHRGDANLVLQELGLPNTPDNYSLIKKFLKKIKKEEERDVATLISHNLMQHIFMGYNQRVRYIQEMLVYLNGKEEIKLSLCCNYPVKEKEGNFFCLKCHKKAEVEVLDKFEIMKMKMNLIEELRAEDKALVEFAERLGYTNKKEDESLVKNFQQNILYVKGDDDFFKKMTGEERETLIEISKLPPLAREAVIRRLEKMVYEEGKDKGEEDEKES